MYIVRKLRDAMHKSGIPIILGITYLLLGPVYYMETNYPPSALLGNGKIQRVLTRFGELPAERGEMNEYFAI